MGAMCTPKEPQQNSIQVTQQKIDQSKCKHLIFEYIQHYGKYLDDDLRQWINNSYDDNYTSNILYLNYPAAIKLKKDLYTSFQTLHQGGWTAAFDTFLKISFKNNQQLIQYEMICNGPDSQNPLIKTNLVFKVISMFTPEGKFKTSIFKQIT